MEPSSERDAVDGRATVPAAARGAVLPVFAPAGPLCGDAGTSRGFGRQCARM